MGSIIPLMPVFVAFLRGMNLGRRRVRNEELCDCFESMGFRGVSAFLASGNVIFESPRRSETVLQKVIQDGLNKRFKYDVPTFVRSAGEIARIAKHTPFPESVTGKSDGKLQVAVLGTEPSGPNRKAAVALQTPQDCLAVKGRELYWLPIGRLTDSDLDFKSLDSLLGAMTVRTHRTMTRLARKLSERD